MGYAKNKNPVSKDGYGSWGFLHLGKSWLGDSQVFQFRNFKKTTHATYHYFLGIVNDMIFAYNIIMLIAWFFFNVINVFSFLCVYSLYLELTDLTNLDHAHMLKVSKFFDHQKSKAETQIFEPKSGPISFCGIEVSDCRKSRLHDSLEVSNT